MNAFIAGMFAVGLSIGVVLAVGGLLFLQVCGRTYAIISHRIHVDTNIYIYIYINYIHVTVIMNKEISTTGVIDCCIKMDMKSSNEKHSYKHMHNDMNVNNYFKWKLKYHSI